MLVAAIVVMNQTVAMICSERLALAGSRVEPTVPEGPGHRQPAVCMSAAGLWPCRLMQG